MKYREHDLAETTNKDTKIRMRKLLAIMRKSSKNPLTHPRRPTGSLPDGVARLVEQHRQKGRYICGNVLPRAAAYAMGGCAATPAGYTACKG